MRVTLLVLFLAVLGIPLEAAAQRPPEVIPSDRHERIALSFDRSAVPGDQVLLPRRTILGHSYAASEGLGAIYLVCKSQSDSERGKCPTADTSEANAYVSSVPLRFTERRSGLTTDLNVRGFLTRIDGVRSCYFEYWADDQFPLWTSVGPDCLGSPPVGTGAELTLESAELLKLVAGKWDATLELQMQKEGMALASQTFTFELTITDHDRVSIYFPEYDQATPHVGLNVKYNPFPTPTIAGKRELEMCLYDGLGSQSNYLEVTISDSGRAAPGRPLDRFSVWHDGGGGGGERDRLDYKIQLQHAGVPISMENGRLQPLSGIDTADLRLVVLPGMSQPVYCVPTPMTLEMPPVDASTKASGYYSGNLRILMNVPTTTP